MGPRRVSTPVMIVVIIVIVLAAGLGYFFMTQGLMTEENLPPEHPPENQPPSGGLTSGPYYHQIYSATSTDGVNWTVDDTLLFDHASVPGAVYFNDKLYVYFVNAEDPEHEKLSVGISEDRGATFTVYDVQISGSNSPYPVDPNPIIDGGQIRLTYLGNFMQGETNKIVTATSSDGINFTEDGVIFTGDVCDPDLFYDEASGEWVLFLNSGAGLIKATALSPTASFTEETDFIWSAGSISSTHKIGDKYYTYYAGMNGISVAEYSNGNLFNIADGIVDFQGLTADPTVAVFGPNDYMMFFKTISRENQPQPNPGPEGGEEITVEFVDSTYAVASGGTSGWFHTGQDADIILSGIDFDNTGGPLLFNHPSGIATDGQRLFLADTFNNRVLIWNTLPTGNVPPDLVLGQKDFTSNDPGLGRDQLNWPFGVATDGTHLVVTDVNNARVLIWNTIPTQNGEPADIVLEGGGAPWSSSQASDLPGAAWGVWTNGEKLVVSNTWAGGSVLIWDTFPTRDNQPADIVLTGGGDMGTPRHITSDGTHLIVGDHNARVQGQPEHGSFFWKTFPTSDDQPYDFYMSKGYGWLRGAFLSDGRLLLMGGDAPELRIWNSFPQDENDEADIVLELRTAGLWAGDYESVAVDGERIYISQGNLNRIIGYSSVPTQSDQLPDFIIGSPDLSTNTLETHFFIQNGVPASNGEELFVTSDFDRKLYVWKNLPDQSCAYPDIVYSLPSEAGDIALWDNTLALAGQDTVYIWKKLPLEGNLPDVVLRGIGDIRFQELKGVALDNRYFYLADYGAGKVYVWEGLPDENLNLVPKFTLEVEGPWRLDSDGDYLLVDTIYAQSVCIYRVADLPTTPAPASSVGGHGRLNLPQAATVSHGHLFIADTGFNRVLAWENIEEAMSGKWPPDVILGKTNLDDHHPAIGRNSLFNPAGICFDGNYLWVGEFKFSNRILRFSPY